jgi:Flp pilus assembly protein TadG
MREKWKVALVGALLLLLGLVAWSIDQQRQSVQQALEQINLTVTVQTQDDE